MESPRAVRIAINVAATSALTSIASGACSLSTAGHNCFIVACCTPKPLQRGYEHGKGPVTMRCRNDSRENEKAWIEDQMKGKWSEEQQPTLGLRLEESGPRELRIVLVGRTGTGKSATRNTILGRREFKSRLSLNAARSGCKEGSCGRDGRRVVVVDTSRLLDPGAPDSVISREVGMCTVMAAPGPHAFVLVISSSRFTPKEAEAVQEIQDLFGEEALRFSLVLFTRMDDLEMYGVTLEEFIRGSSYSLRAVVEGCGGRYLGFNNRAPWDVREQQAKALISLVLRMVEDNGGSCYMNERFERAEEQIQRWEREVRGERRRDGRRDGELTTPRQEAKNRVLAAGTRGASGASGELEARTGGASGALAAIWNKIFN